MRGLRLWGVLSGEVSCPPRPVAPTVPVAPTPVALAPDATRAAKDATKSADDTALADYDRKVQDHSTAVATYRLDLTDYTQWIDEDARAASVLTSSVLPHSVRSLNHAVHSCLPVVVFRSLRYWLSFVLRRVVFVVLVFLRFPLYLLLVALLCRLLVDLLRRRLVDLLSRRLRCGPQHRRYSLLLQSRPSQPRQPRGMTAPPAPRRSGHTISSWRGILATAALYSSAGWFFGVFCCCAISIGHYPWSSSLAAKALPRRLLVVPGSFGTARPPPSTRQENISPSTCVVSLLSRALLLSSRVPAPMLKMVSPSLAMAEEIAALERTGTWDLVSPLLVFVLSREHGRDYDETFAPVAHMTTVRTLLAVASVRRWSVSQLDVLSDELSEEVYMQPPPGYSVPDGMVCHLRRSLYGLKQAPRAWFERFASMVTAAGFLLVFMIQHFSFTLLLMDALFFFSMLMI
ncbi:hypothetical protein QYE76_066334 [Lolium multiflorum]|uniref:Reverse transcriptase Ty1/copia-type domain-containing protein n=1 Tax=Lolium multiflorum TaxID=4521 RepID=A0AAD8WBX1_LOLMU|nr:hypothetical protein QYE76_066334 [Lolium multiflorum]